jgi:nitrous oxidase accessory protein
MTLGAAFSRLLTLGAVGATLGSCNVPAARPIAYGKEVCAHCHMTVADPRFAGQLVTSRGLVYSFDDVECLASFAASRSVGSVHSLWVNDFRHPDRRLDATTARYWRSQQLRTPMSSGVVAVSDGEEAESLAAATGAVLESWGELLAVAERDASHRGHQPVAVSAPPTKPPVKPESAADLVVEPNGEIRSLTAALAMARPHARILVRPGTYREPPIVVSKAVTIDGEGWPVFIGGDHEVFTVTADSVTLRGLVISHVAPAATADRAGIRISKVRGCTIENNRLFDTFFGIYLAQSSGCRVIANTVRGRGKIQGLSGNAIHSWNSRDLTIQNNDLAGHRDGIYLEFTTGSRIEGNRSAGNLRYGLHFMFSHNCEYTNNRFTHNGAGVAVMFSDSVTMRRNRFERNQGSAAYGLLLKELRDSRIELNRFAENTVGLWTEGTSRVTVTGNDFVANGWALRVLGDATENQFRGNRFLQNSFDVGTVPGRSTNILEGNLWDQYRGYDLDRDGYGDVPFQPVRLFSLLVQESEPALILLHSFFIDLLDLAERVIPALTPETMTDRRPLMRSRS